MAPPKGTTNNPKGRPPKERALTHILERALAETRALPEGERKAAGKQLLARYLVDAALTGRLPYKVAIPLETGPPLEVAGRLAPREWLDLVKFLYSHIDGPPKAALELSGNPDRPLVVERRADLAALSEEELAVLESLLNKGADAGGS